MPTLFFTKGTEHNVNKGYRIFEICKLPNHMKSIWVCLKEDKKTDILKVKRKGMEKKKKGKKINYSQRWEKKS